MKQWFTLFLCFQLYLTPLAWSYEQIPVACNGTSPSSDLTLREKEIASICKKALTDKNLPEQIDTSFSADKILPMIGGCFLGAKDSIVSDIEGIAFLVKLFAKEIPSYAWDKIKELFSENTNAIGAVDQLSQKNVSTLSKAKILATQYLDSFKKFLKIARDMIVKEHQSFFCYPKPLQTRILCQIVSDVFLLVFSPSKFIKGAKWTSEIASMSQNLIKAILKSHQGEMKLAKKIELAAEAVNQNTNASEAVKIVSKLDDSSFIVSKNVGGETVHYLSSNIKGQKIMREMVLDEHTKFFSIQGQGKKVIDQIISQGTTKGGAIVLLDINNLGKVNYFNKGLSAGDEYLKAVSDTIRKTAGDKNIKIFRTGGDEISLFTEGMSPDEVYKFSKQLSRNIVADRAVQKIFIEERQILIDKIAKATLANKKQEIQELTNTLNEVEKFDGSVSIGSHMLKTGDDYASIQTKANEGLSKGKATYKKAKGLPYDKYGTPAGDYNFETVDGKLIPPVFNPS